MLRVRVWVPDPQKREHWFQRPNADTWQSIGQSWVLQVSDSVMALQGFPPCRAVRMTARVRDRLPVPHLAEGTA